MATPEAAGQTRVASPVGRLVPQAPGAFRIDVATARDGTARLAASAWQGRLAWQPLAASGAEIGVAAGQRVEFSVPAGPAAPQALTAPADDDFARFVRQRDAAFAGRTAARYVSPEMTGTEDLDLHGHWSQMAEYGAVWWPQVGAGWAPYRLGRWVRVAPWGWTWIADEPWGFAPFHYGRWVRWQGRWGWVPGRYVARPVYAPALVGGTPAAGAAVAQGADAAPPDGAVPLAPRETCVPRFAASAAFVRRLNAGQATVSVATRAAADETRAQPAARSIPSTPRHRGASEPPGKEPR